MRYFSLFVLVLIIHYQLFGSEKDYIFEQISPDAGFAFNAVSSIVEDVDGFIWFGCDNGLHYYNGLEITKYNFDPERKDSPPSNKINKIYKDWNDLLWICTSNGICYYQRSSNSFVRIDFKETIFFQPNYDASRIVQYSEDTYITILNSKLYSFHIDEKILRDVLVEGNSIDSPIVYLERGNNGNIYAGTETGDLYVSKGNINNFSLTYSSHSAPVRTVCAINSQLWIGYDNFGIDVIDASGKLIEQFNSAYKGNRYIPSNRVRKIIQRKNGDIWIGTYDGILIIRKNGNQIVRQNSSNQLPHNSIYDFCIDKNDGIWVGTWSGGVAYYNVFNYRFEHVRKIADGLSTTSSVIASFVELEDGNILIGSETLGLLEYNLSKKNLVSDNISPKEIPIKHIKSIASDKDNALWIGTFNEGLWRFKNKKFEQVISNVDFVTTSSSILATGDKIWMGTRGHGLYLYDTKNNHTSIFLEGDSKIGSITSDWIWKTFLDSKDNLWVCTDFGLSVKWNGSDSFERFFYNESNSSISRNMIYTIAEDDEGNIWLGTNGGGIDIYDPEDDSFSKISKDENFETAEIYSIIKDFNGNMWISSNQGIFQYNTKLKVLKAYTAQDGIIGKQYSPNSGYINSSGKIFFGGANGFNIIDPLNVKENPVIPEAFLSKLLINYLSINEQEVNYINSKQLAAINKLELDYYQNSLVFSFVTNNFIKPSKSKFKYRIRNYLDEWIETKYGRDISLTKIPPGNYVLEIIGSNNDGIWNLTPKEIQIIIHPPFWLSWYAFVLYVIFISIVLILIIRNIAFRIKVKKELIAERYKHEAEELIFSEKTNFFTNISHEFRTPLTLIISPLNKLIKKFEDESVVQDHLQVMKRNADRLLRLTNQILDFRLIELGKVKINLKENDIVSLCKDVYECFEFQLIEKEINCIFTSTFKSFLTSIDSDKVEKVVYNLMSNALKYSNEKGQIILSVEQIELTERNYQDTHVTGNRFIGRSLEIKIKDNGRGITPTNLPLIFDRFYVDTHNVEAGTGIGLHICQEYIRLHNGNIIVSTELGKGSSFSINLPLEQNINFEKENIVIQSHFDKLPGSVKVEEQTTNSSVSNKIILFAEDNDELRVYLKNVLMEKFKVLTAKNGQQALEIATEVIPDVIISDILMPGGDGLELTSKIRNNSKTNHIPIILLTALTEDKHQIDSINRGADFYLTKPVDEALLFARIDNILSNRETLKKKYDDKINANSSLTHSEDFIQKVERIVEQNLQNPSFEIEHLASKLNISRSSLHRKIKSLTNQSSSEYVRDIRLTTAVKLMKTDKFNMDEIGVFVGFNSTSYFIRSFKKKYGKTPKEFYNQLMKP